jgi:two-component system phosphate regulon sensor histidine kinase PhoR
MSMLRLRWMIGLMSIALIALIAFQWQWITTAVETNEDRFHKDVMDAMSNVVNELERREVLQVINRQMMRSKAMQNTFQGSTQIYPNRQEEAVSFYYQWTDSSSTQDHMNVTIAMDPKGNIVYESNKEAQLTVERTGPNGNVVYRSDPKDGIRVLEDTVAELKESLERLAQIEAGHFANQNQLIQQTLRKMNSKSQLLVSVLEEMMYSRPLEFRVSADVLDSLLDIEFKEKGIKTSFEFGVWRPNPMVWFAGHTQNREKAIIRSEYVVNLFPNDIYNQAEKLSVIFPNKERYLSRKIWINMASSGVLLLVIILSFGYSIYTILRQKKLSEMKNDFINNMTHEFKTPIATIGLAVEALQDQALAQVPNIRERYIGVIGDENKRLGHQVEKVLQMAIVDRKELKLCFEKADINEVIHRAVAKISLQLESRKGEIQLALDADPSTCDMDTTQMMHVILNLLDNAIKYSEDAPKILVRTLLERDVLKVSVKDHGIGMTREAQKNIFQSFYRVSTGNLHDVKGFGLGLAFVKNIVDEHHGNIEVESEPGKGTKIILTIPKDHHE